MKPRAPYIAVLMALALLLPALACATAQETLEKVVVLKRHGVRAAMSSPERLASFSARPWPRFDVPAGDLTTHGAALERQFGAYYRARYLQLGLLRNDDCDRVYYWANRTQRTIASAEAMADTLTPGCNQPIHHVADGERDPMFDGPPALRSPAALALARAALAGRVGGDAAAWNRAQRLSVDQLQALLLQCERVPCAAHAGAGKQRIDSAVATLPEYGQGLPEIAGPAATASGLSESLLMAWADGADFAALGWHGLDDTSVIEASIPHQAEFALRLRAPDIARMASSQLAARLTATLLQGSSLTSPYVPVGDDATLTVVSGHDGTLTLLAGLLDLHWQLPGYLPDQTPPGGALVFERWRLADGERVLRVRYTAQSPQQLRRNLPLTLDAPPPEAAVFVPGCSTASEHYDCSLERFAQRIAQLIDPAFVVPAP